MSDYLPNWYELLILAIAAWRTFQLVAEDDILDAPRRKLLRLGDWEKDGDDVPDDYRTNWGAFLTCPYCAGFWISLLWFLAWLAFGDWALVAGMPFVINAGVVAGHKTLGSE
jgi:Protein of unknown function (DUF1360)